MIDIMILIILVPVIGFLFASFRMLVPSSKIDMAIPIFSIALLISETILSLLLFVKVNSGGDIYLLSNNMKVDWFASVIFAIISLFCLIIGFYSISYFEKKNYYKFYTLFFTLMLGLLLTVFANHLFVLFLGWELLVVTGYILVVFNQTKQSYEAGMKYLIISSFGSLEFLFGIGLLTGITSSLHYSQLGFSILSSPLGKLAFVFIIMGVGVTAGMIFLNQWLPDAHPEAPSPVSALLSGIVVKMGIYVLYRVFSLLAPSNAYYSTPSQMIVVIAILTMTEGNIMVFAQFMRKTSIDFKRILAYSTTVHLGFLLLLVPIQSSAYALSLHILNHGLAKILLFLISGTLIHKYGTRDLRKLQGIGSKDKMLGIPLFIGFLSLAGFPGTGGFISKITILITFFSLEGSLNMILVLILVVINTILAFIGYIWILKKLVFDPYHELEVRNTGSQWISNTTYIIISIIILILGFYPSILWNI